MVRMIRMRNEDQEDLNRLRILNMLQQGNPRFGEIMKATRLSRGVTGKHLRNLVREECVFKDESRHYHLTKDGEKEALLLDEIIRGKKWRNSVSLPDIKLVAKEGYATVTFDGGDQNAIENVYNHFESFVETAREEGFDVTGILRLHKTKDT